MNAQVDNPIPGEAPYPWRRSLVLLWLGQAVSHLGDALFLSVMFFVAIDVTGSKTGAGLLIALNFLPALALGLFAGTLVDRADRRQIMIYADLLRAFSVGSIPILHALGALSSVTLGIAMFCLATGSTVFNPALKAFVPQVTPLPRLTAAASAFQVAEYSALVLGPLLAALLIPALGSINLLGIDAASFLFSAGCIAFVRRMPSPSGSAEDGTERKRRLSSASIPRIMKEAFSGAAAVLAIPVVRSLLIVATVNNLAIMGLAHVGTPLLVRETLGLGAAAYSRSLQYFFVGMAAASAAFGLWGRRLPKGPTIMVGIILDGLTFIPFAFCTSLGDLQAAQFFHAIFIPLIIIPRTVLIQQLVPGPLHGRAFALVNVTVFGMMAVSSGLTGILAETIPPPTLFLILGSVGAIPGLIGLFHRGLRAAR